MASSQPTVTTAPTQIVVKVTLDPGALMPILAEGGSVGYDLFCPRDIDVPFGRLVKIDTGVHLESPFAMMLKLRSSTVDQGFVMPDWGLIDPSYRGSVRVPIIFGDTARGYSPLADHRPADKATIRQGTRFAQLVFFLAETPTIQVVSTLSVTARGAGGFGSTGK